jgi:hypothetical protein
MRAVLLMPLLLVVLACATTGAPAPAPSPAGTVAPIAPGDVEPARALIGAALLERVVRAELPLPLEIPAGAVQVIDVRYCGPDASGRARALVALTTGGQTGGGAAAALRGADDCSGGLEALAQRVLPLAAGAKPPAVAVAELAAAARPGELALSVEKVALAGERGAPGAEGLRALAARPALPPIPTRALEVGDPGAPPAAVVSLAFEWRPDGVALIGAPGAAPPPVRPGGREKPAAADLALDLPLTFINALVQAVLARGPIKVPLDPEEVTLTDVGVARAGDQIAVTGRATPRSVGQPFDVTVNLAGADLQVADVQVTAPQENCAAQGPLQRLGCNSRNAGRTAAAEALAAGLRQRYRGQLVRALVGPQQMKLDVAGRPLQVRAELQRLGARESTVESDATGATSR